MKLQEEGPGEVKILITGGTGQVGTELQETLGGLGRLVVPAREVILAGQPPPGEAGAALQRLALRKLRNAARALLPVIVRLERLGLWQAGTCSQQAQPVRPLSFFATVSHDS